ncbi:RDD family protein [Bacillus songklensis]|uniref:RDD family protein n=1 Tax=Bacillus songklensis TaxID=1069116 RepID=A0ABV8B128_9BACI
MNDYETHTEKQKEEHESKAIMLPEPEKEKMYIWYAGFWIRFWAYLLDLLVVMSIQRLLVTPLFKGMGGVRDDGLFSPVNVMMALIFYLYFVFMTKRFGQTIGKMVFGLKVISLTDERLTWSTVIFRELVGRYISKTVLLLGYIVVAFTKKKRGFHDYFSETSVIYENKQPHLLERSKIQIEQ